MKKIAIAAAVTAALSAGVAQAYTVGTFSNGFVVPHAVHNGSSYDTAVGITSLKPVVVYWTFFDKNSGHQKDGCIDMTANDFASFTLSDPKNMVPANMDGYLLFVAAKNDDGKLNCKANPTLSDFTYGAISANAFQVDLANHDVAFVPVIDGPVRLKSGTTLGYISSADALQSVDGAMHAGGADAGSKVYMRYFIDGKPGGDDTTVVVWSSGDHSGTNIAFAYDTEQNPTGSFNLEMKNTELDLINVEDLNLPSSYTDGFITWTPTTDAGDVFVYSVVSSPAFGAVQTLLGAYGQ